MKRLFFTKDVTVNKTGLYLFLVFIGFVIGVFFSFVFTNIVYVTSKKNKVEELQLVQQPVITTSEADKQTEKPQWVNEVIKYMPAFKYSIDAMEREKLQNTLMDYFNKYESIGSGEYKYSKWASDLLSYLEKTPSLDDLSKEERSRIFNEVLLESYNKIDIKNIGKYVETADHLSYLDQGDKNRLKSTLSNRILQYVDLLYRDRRGNFQGSEHLEIAALRDKNHWLQAIESITREEYLKFLSEDKRRLIVDFANSYIEKFQ